ncbi:MAG: hypothetical protein ACE5ES_02365 [Candidatus Nanoarchaeia archaeon]
MFWWFSGKREVERVEEETRKGFESVKKDINAVSGWIKHLDSEKNLHEKEVNEIKGVLSSIKNDLEGLKNVVSLMTEMPVRKQTTKNKQLSNKQTAVYAVQTAVQTPNLEQFSITERAIIWILLNTDMKLSYDDLAAMLGKERSTIRGQINSIKQKGEIIEEQVEKNGKKRVYVPEEIKEKMLKKTKVRVKSSKKHNKL